MSLWQFGTFTGNTVEFEGLVKAFGEGRLPEVRYLMAEPQYAVYPFQHPMPRPVVGFPEISMFRAWPWGGYGANPMPRLISELWTKYGGKLGGGFPYSEGIYTDINSIIMLRLYRENQSPEATIREYLSCEFGLSGNLLEQTARAVWDMEGTLERNVEKETHRYVILHPEKAQEIEDVILQADQSLSPNQRSARLWKLIYYRARIDAELVRNHFYRNEKVTEYFNRLILLSHLEHSGPYTKPDIAEGVFTVQDWEKER